MQKQVSGLYLWPFDASLRAPNTALIIVDMQVDYCGSGGWLDQIGSGIENTRRPINPLARVLAAMRDAGFSILYTREGLPPGSVRPESEPAMAQPPPRAWHRRRRQKRSHPGARRARLADHSRACPAARRAGDRQARNQRLSRERFRPDFAPPSYPKPCDLRRYHRLQCAIDASATPTIAVTNACSSKTVAQPSTWRSTKRR